MSRLIIIDWGTTSFRAWLVDRQTGAVLDTLPSGQGLRAMAGQSFPDYARQRLAAWRDETSGTPPVLMAGMVGAPSGWRKAGQPPLPVGAADLAAHVVPAEGFPNAWILPGAHVRHANGDVDVIRGEEVQVLGALRVLDRTGGMICLPGTHSKWVRAEENRMVDFATFMTGELHAVLMQHSLLGEPAPKGAPFDSHAFTQGLEQSETPGGPLHHIFSSRGRMLYNTLAPEGIASFLSGVLIGSELEAALSLREPGTGTRVVLVGGEALSPLYQQALQRKGIAVDAVPADQATRSGVLAVAGVMSGPMGSPEPPRRPK